MDRVIKTFVMGNYTITLFSGSIALEKSLGKLYDSTFHLLLVDVEVLPHEDSRNAQN